MRSPARHDEHCLPDCGHFEEVVMPDHGHELARMFHETYERLAPEFGYETREATREFDSTSPNGRLMIAVCAELLNEYAKLKRVRDAAHNVRNAELCDKDFEELDDALAEKEENAQKI